MPVYALDLISQRHQHADSRTNRLSQDMKRNACSPRVFDMDRLILHKPYRPNRPVKDGEDWGGSRVAPAGDACLVATRKLGPNYGPSTSIAIKQHKSNTFRERHVIL